MREYASLKRTNKKLKSQVNKLCIERYASYHNSCCYLIVSHSAVEYEWGDRGV